MMATAGKDKLSEALPTRRKRKEGYMGKRLVSVGVMMLAGMAMAGVADAQLKPGKEIGCKGWCSGSK